MGKIEIYTGPMRSGKSDTIARKIKRFCLANRKVVYYVPALDTRTGNEIYIKSVRGEREYIIPVKKLDVDFTKENVISVCAGYDVVAFDEGQFYGESIIDLCQELRRLNKIVLISGLDMDYLQQPFGYMGQLMAIADTVTKLTAICENCGGEAPYTKRNVPQEELILIGDTEYAPRCGWCYSNNL